MKGRAWLFTSDNGFPALDIELTRASAHIVEEITGGLSHRRAPLAVEL